MTYVLTSLYLLLAFHVIHSSTFCDFFTLFFFNDTATTEIYTLSLHDALQISRQEIQELSPLLAGLNRSMPFTVPRSEEHTSELQSRRDLVCRLLLEKKKKNLNINRDAFSTSLHTISSTLTPASIRLSPPYCTI